MNRSVKHRYQRVLVLVTVGLVLIGLGQVQAQDFDFQKLEKNIPSYTVIIEMKVELSFGMQSAEHELRLLGTVVTDDGLVMFDGSTLSTDDSYASVSGMSMRITPTKVEAFTLDDEQYEGEYLGVDRFTHIGFLRITDAPEGKFKPVKFSDNHRLQVGDWVGLFMLLPKFVYPPVASDIGMLSAMIQTPEYFPLIIGFGEMQLTSVLYTEDLAPIGVLGMLSDPSNGGNGQSGLMESFGRFQLPMLGAITGDRLQKLIDDPPRVGEIDRAWLGITLQALTEDIAEFINVDAPGGIIVNSILKASPAEKAGLEVGDVIHMVNGEQVEVDREEEIPIFQRSISEMSPGTSVELAVQRPGDAGIESLKLLVNLEAAPIAAADAAEYENESLEFKVRNLVFADYHYYNLDDESLTGVVVSELKRGGLSSLGGLQIGDIIQRVDNNEVNSVDEIQEVVDRLETEAPAEVIFFVWRNNKTLFVNVKTDW